MSLPLLAASILAVACIAAAVLLFLARMLRRVAFDIRTEPYPLDLDVAAVGDGAITLRANGRTRKPTRRDWGQNGVFGLETATAFHTIGPLQRVTANEMTFAHTPGRGTIAPGDAARLEMFVYEGDPQSAHGIPFEEVTVHGPLGPMPAWQTPGDHDTWAILTHGKGSSRMEGLRILPTLRAAGFPTLTITYRNDFEAPRCHTHFYSYGRHEWEDLEAAVRYARANGARRVLLIGWSMGGAISLSFMLRSAEASAVCGLVLDAPVLHFAETVAHGARILGLPTAILPASNRVASLRYKVHWGELDYLARAHEIALPILLFHGDDDRTVPISTSDALAQAFPGHVTYERFADTGHCLAWNVDPARYESALAAFLTEIHPLQIQEAVSQQTMNR